MNRASKLTSPTDDAASTPNTAVAAAILASNMEGASRPSGQRPLGEHDGGVMQGVVDVVTAEVAAEVAAGVVVGIMDEVVIL